MSEPTRCPVCLTHVQDRTLARYGGVCRRCAVNPKSYFNGSMTLLVFAITAAIAPFAMTAQIRTASETGTAVRTVFPFGTLYRAFGPIGFRAIFWIVSLVALVAAYRCWIHWRDLKKAIENAKS